jgi:GH25 family lysozyme M1 (1,4-beta-N-acetylmuramidase)
MKRNPPQPRHPRMRSIGAALLTASLLTGTGLSTAAYAVEPTPTPTPSQASAAPPESTMTPSSPAQPAPGATQRSTPAPQPPATSAPTATAPQTMAEAIGVGGAEMGQRSKRVTASSLTAAARTLTTESLSTEGTWTPSFGVQGLDVSAHQPSVDWQQQWNMGARFAYVKASEGNYYTNELFGSQYQGSRSVGMIRGAYHFAIPNWSSGADQARYFVQSGGSWSADGYTMPPVLDLEFNPYAGRTINGFYFGDTCYGMSGAQIASWVRDFGNTMRSLTGRLPAIYTNTSWWNQCLGNQTGFGDYPLWVAAYPSSPSDNAGAVPAGWPTYSIWQYSSTGPFSGDSNVWNGDYASLRQFAGTALPTGSFDELSLVRNGSEVSLRARGWSVDLANIPASNQTHVYVTGPDGVTTGYPWTANSSRPDVNQVNGYGPSHGFDGTVRITKSGAYKACAYSIGTFGNTSLGCKTINATGVEAPTGSFDDLGQIRTSSKVTLQLKGWAVDLANSGASSYADTYITGPDGATKGYRMPANVSRPDVQAVTGLGASHGFDYQVPVSAPGSYRACTYAIGQNSNLALGCKTTTVQASPVPMGAYDAVSLTQSPNSASLQVTGWALDPSYPAQSIPVYVYVKSKDGLVAAKPAPVISTANLVRNDVNSALRTVGQHGFQVKLPLTNSGSYTVCVQANAVAPLAAGPKELGCKEIVVAQTPATMGSLDAASVQVVSGKASVVTKGWTLDPVMPGFSNPVHVYVTYPDGSTKGYPFTANLKRPDVNSALQTVGDHGYSTSVPITARGQYSVCTYGVALSVFSSANSQLGCRTLNY